jgi:hypothetical protein
MVKERNSAEPPAGNIRPSLIVWHSKQTHPARTRFVLPRIAACLLLVTLCALGQTTAPKASGSPDLKQLLADSLRAIEHNRKLSENYTWQETRILRRLDKDGAVKHQASKTYDVILIDGEEHDRLILEDGAPLSPEEERKEQRKVEKAIAERQSESPAQRERRLRKLQQEREKEERLRQAIPDAFRFELLGEEYVDGREAWKLYAVPNPSFQPFNRESRMLTKLKGTIWIDKQTLHWLRAEVETLDTISFGLLLARVDKGSTMIFDQLMVNGEVWMPRRVEVNFDARLALVKKFHIRTEVLYSEYKKFSADSRVVSTTLVEEPK